MQRNFSLTDDYSGPSTRPQAGASARGYLKDGAASFHTVQSQPLSDHRETIGELYKISIGDPYDIKCDVVKVGLESGNEPMH